MIGLAGMILLVVLSNKVTPILAGQRSVAIACAYVIVLLPSVVLLLSAIHIQQAKAAQLLWPDHPAECAARRPHRPRALRRIRSYVVGPGRRTQRPIPSKLHHLRHRQISIEIALSTNDAWPHFACKPRSPALGLPRAWWYFTRDHNPPRRSRTEGHGWRGGICVLLALTGTLTALMHIPAVTGDGTLANANRLLQDFVAAVSLMFWHILFASRTRWMKIASFLGALMIIAVLVALFQLDVNAVAR